MNASSACWRAAALLWVAMTAAACLETLATCRLNRYEPNELLEFDYSVTQPSPEQMALLQALGFTSLVRHQELAARITPR